MDQKHKEERNGKRHQRSKGRRSRTQLIVVPVSGHTGASLNPQTEPTTRIDPTMTGLFCLPVEGRAQQGYRDESGLWNVANDVFN